MLTLFQNITEELTPLEKQTLVPMLIDTLAFTNEHRRHTGANICRWFEASGYHVSGSRLRKMINYIRVLNVKKGAQCNLGNMVVIGASNGYFVTSKIEIIKDQIQSLQGRMDSMAAVVDSLQAQLLNIQKCR